MNKVKSSMDLNSLSHETIKEAYKQGELFVRIIFKGKVLDRIDIQVYDDQYKFNGEYFGGELDLLGGDVWYGFDDFDLNIWGEDGISSVTFYGLTPDPDDDEGFRSVDTDNFVTIHVDDSLKPLTIHKK